MFRLSGRSSKTRPLCLYIGRPSNLWLRRSTLPTGRLAPRCRFYATEDGATKPTGSRKDSTMPKEKDTSSKPRKSRRPRTNPRAVTRAAHFRLLQETRDVLKDLRTAQDKAMGVITAKQSDKNGNGDETLTSTTNSKAKSTAKSKAKPKAKSEFKAEDPQPKPSAASKTEVSTTSLELPSQQDLAAVDLKRRSDQVTLLAGALSVLKNVLVTQPAPAPPEVQSPPSPKGIKRKTKKLKGDQILAPILAQESAKVSGRAASSQKKSAFTSFPASFPLSSPSSPLQGTDGGRDKQFWPFGAELPKAQPEPDGPENEVRRRKTAKETEPSPADFPLGPPGPGGKKSGKPRRYSIHSVPELKLKLRPIEEAQRAVPRLAHGLDRVLFNPGTYHVQDPRSRVFNFDPYVSTIMPIREFDFNALKRYVTSSKDKTLISLAAKHHKKYSGSTSSMTSMLTHFHYLISHWRPINPALMSKGFQLESTNFTRINRAPAAAFLHFTDGTYAIDADKEFDTANILSMLGKSMEKLLTLPKEEFEMYRRENSDQLSEETRNEPEAFHYTTMGDIMMRSQLDAYDDRLPGSGMFDLKTRAVVSIRMDAKEFQNGLGYEIRGRTGQWQSFEREYYDMIRSAFLKYSLQVRMGRMDGIFVAFHNTERIFGFQYISLSEMDESLHGTPDVRLGNAEFKLSLHLLNKILDKATNRFPKRTLRLHFETRPSDPPFMYVFAKPVTEAEVEKVQDASRAAVEQFEFEMMGLAPTTREESAAVEEPEGMEDDEEDADATAVEDAEEQEGEGEGKDSEETRMEQADKEKTLDAISQAVWEDMMDKVEDAMENDALEIASVREAIEHALEQSELLRSIPQDQSRDYVEALLAAITSTDLESAAQDIQNSDSLSEVSSGTITITVEQDRESVQQVQEVGETDTPASTHDEAGSKQVQQVQQVQQVEAVASNGTQDGSETSVVFEDGLQHHDSADESSLTSPADLAKAPTKPDDSSLSLSLKDLILRLAAKAQASPSDSREYQEDKDTHEPLGDSQRIRRFEKILSEMMSSSKAGGGSSSVGLEPPAEEQIVEPEPAEPEPFEPESVIADEEDRAGEELLGMIITVRNGVDGQFVKRPVKIGTPTRWELQYSIEELDYERAMKLYAACKKRRKNLLSHPDVDESGVKPPRRFDQAFREKLRHYTMAGRKFRANADARARELGELKVYGMKGVRVENVFGKRDENVIVKGEPEGMDGN